MAPYSAVDLGAVAIEAAVRRSAIPPAEFDYVLMGHVLQAGTGQITARQAAVAAGIPIHVPAMTINKVCLSSVTAIALADQMIRAGEITVAVAGGLESMTNAPYILPDMRSGRRLGDGRIVDAMVHDGLWSTFTGLHMGESSDTVNDALGISRADQDAWAARSHQRAAGAWESGRFAEEVVPVEVADRTGAVAVVGRDEGIRPGTTFEALSRLAPAFSPRGTLTAGNSSQLSDGAAAVVVTSAELARAMNLERLAEIVAHGMCSGRFEYLHTVPATALEVALKKAGMQISDLGLSGERGVRLRGRARERDARRRAGHCERQRRIRRSRPRSRLDGCPDGCHAAARDAPAWHRVWRRYPLRRWRPRRGSRPRPALMPASAARSRPRHRGWTATAR